MVWLLSVLPAERERHSAFLAAELPSRFEHGWDIALRGPDSQLEFDEMCAFEDWVYSGEDAGR